MSQYSVKGKGWRYNFYHKKERYSSQWYKTKREAAKEEAIRREELLNPPSVITMPTDMAFLDLLNKRLDHLEVYRSERHYKDVFYYARRWIQQWKDYDCSEISMEMVEQYLMGRMKETSGITANQDLRNLRATFNFGLNPKRKWIEQNPTEGIDFFPVEKKIKYVPSKQDVLKVIMVADPDTQDYLWTIVSTMGRMSEINKLKWEDVDLVGKSVTLYTRKKKGGHLTPRKIPMTEKLFDVLSHRYNQRDKRKPWVYWHRYWSRKASAFVEGPYIDRKKIMKALCKKADVRYFRYHALRHCGASLLDNLDAGIGTIQRFLGHQNRKTTEIYLHSIGNIDRERISLLDNVLS